MQFIPCCAGLDAKNIDLDVNEGVYDLVSLIQTLHKVVIANMVAILLS